jgi:hypothetical protein
MLYTGVDDDHYGSDYYGSLRRFLESESTKRMDPVIIIIVTTSVETPLGVWVETPSGGIFERLVMADVGEPTDE